MSNQFQSRHRNAPIRPAAPVQPSPLARAGTASGGQALDKHTQASMSARFGHDFSSVRIHTDAQAADSAAALGANAYAHGSDIVFGGGRYTPGSPETERLLAHELTHVVQQAQGGPGDANRASRKDDSSEREAGTLAGDVAAGRSVEVQAAPGAAIARDERDAPPPFMMTNPNAYHPDAGFSMYGTGPADPPRNMMSAPNVYRPDAGFSMYGTAKADGTGKADVKSSPTWWDKTKDSTPYAVVTNDALSAGVALGQTELGDLHAQAAGKTIAAQNAMQDEFRVRDYGDNHGWSLNESGTADEIAAQKSLWKAGADLEGGAEDAMQVERTAANTASKFSPAMKALGTLGRILAPLGLYSDVTGMIKDWKDGEHADAVADGMGATSAAIGTVDAAAAFGTWTGLASGGGALASTAEFLNPAGAVLGAGAGGYAAGKLALKGANTYAKDSNIFGKGDDGESRDSTGAAADAGQWVKEHTGNGVFGSILGGATAIGSSWGTAAYSGLHAAGHGLKEDAHWLWNHTLGDSGPSDKEIAANQAKADAVMTENADAMMNAEVDSDLENDMHYTQTAHDDPPPPAPR